MKAKVICIEGFWNDEQPRVNFEYRCLVVPLGVTDAQREQLLELANDESLFYLFDEDELIIGDHGEFTVFFYNPISEIEIGEMK